MFNVAREYQHFQFSWTKLWNNSSKTEKQKNKYFVPWIEIEINSSPYPNSIGRGAGAVKGPILVCSLSNSTNHVFHFKLTRKRPSQITPVNLCKSEIPQTSSQCTRSVLFWSDLDFENAREFHVIYFQQQKFESYGDDLNLFNTKKKLCSAIWLPILIVCEMYRWKVQSNNITSSRYPCAVWSYLKFCQENKRNQNSNLFVIIFALRCHCT